MSTLPTRFAPFIVAFSGLFRQRTWRHAEALLVGAILTPGIRTVARVLRVLGRADQRQFVNYHRVLSRAVWSSRAASRILLGLLVHAFVPEGPIVLGLDDTLERRRGAQIRAKGIYYDAVRSSHSHFVKSSGLRWLSVMLLAPVPWAKRVWALPVLTALAPSARYDQERGVRHKRLTDWGRQLLRQLRRWLPERSLIMVADASFAAIDCLAALAPEMTCITRFRLDARLFAPAPPHRPHTPGRPRVRGARLPSLKRTLIAPRTRWQRVTVPGWYGQTSRAVDVVSDTALWDAHGTRVAIRWVLVRDPLGHFKPQALLCTDLTLEPVTIVQYFIQRWQVEVTFEEARRHLGLETQRQWSDRAIARTTPIVLGLFSLVTLLATRLVHASTLPLHETAWYHKATPTFSDALATVRAELWRHQRFRMSTSRVDISKSARRLLTRLTNILSEAA